MTPGPVSDSYPGPDPDPPVPPIADAEAFAEEFGLDQVVVIGRKHGEGGFECVTTWGRSDADARVCDLIASRFKTFVMEWTEDHPDEISERVRLGRAGLQMREALVAALETGFGERDPTNRVSTMVRRALAAARGRYEDED